MKYVVVFIFCLFCNSFETSAIYSTEKQIVFTPHSTILTPKKLPYKERVALKYLKLKEKSSKKMRYLLAAAIFLAIAIGLTIAARKSNASVPKNGFTGSNDGCLKGVLALVSFVTSVVLFVVAIVASA
jgi:hypothetical protein